MTDIVFPPAFKRGMVIYCEKGHMKHVKVNC